MPLSSSSIKKPAAVSMFYVAMALIGNFLLAAPMDNINHSCGQYKTRYDKIILLMGINNGK